MKFLEVSYTSIKRKPQAKHLKMALVVILVLALFSIISLLVSYPRLKTTYAAAQKTLDRAKILQTKLKDQDVLGVREQSMLLQENIKQTQRELEYFGYVSYIPFINAYYNDANHLLKAGNASTEAVSIASDALIPFADSLGLKGAAASDSAEDKASKLVQIMPKILPEVDVLEGKIKEIKKEIDDINPNRYPTEFRGVKLRSTLASFKDYVNGIESMTPELKPILSTLPSSLGDPKPKTYIILLQNDAELRSTGGFITSVAYLTLSKGRISTVSSEDVYRIDDRIRNHPSAPEPISTYLKLDKFYLRDTNLSPDFVESMRLFDSLYKTSADKIKYDGIIALDTKFVEKLLSVTGPVTTDRYHETFSSSPSVSGVSDVVYKLELYSQKLLRQSDDRKELLGDLLNSLLRTVLRAPAEKWQPLVQATIQSTQEKHLLMYSLDQDTQRLLEKYNMAGRIVNFDGDYLHINQNNLGGLKSNLFVNEVIEQDINIDKNGEVTKTVKLYLNNPYRADGWLNSTYRDYIRFYVPEGSSLTSLKPKGSVAKDLGKTTLTTFTTLEPQGNTTVEVSYKLPFKISKGEVYKLLVQKQPGSKPQQIIIKLNGKELENTKLTSDKEFSFKVP